MKGLPLELPRTDTNPGVSHWNRPLGQWTEIVRILLVVLFTAFPRPSLPSNRLAQRLGSPIALSYVAISVLGTAGATTGPVAGKPATSGLFVKMPAARGHDVSVLSGRMSRPPSPW